MAQGFDTDKALTSIELPLPRFAGGKVREMFELDGDRLLVVATDRISAYDVVMAEGIPDKGRVLNRMSMFWFDLLNGVCPNHFISASVQDLPPQLREFAGLLDGRFSIAKRLNMLKVEFVVRGYLVGSGWKDYLATGSVCGIRLPEGMREADELETPIFTPATKAEVGHDENITAAQAAEIAGPEAMKNAEAYSIALYSAARDHARRRGIILADTKFEFGLDPAGRVTLADEVLTPDSSRFWPADQWEPGSSPPSFDKQFLRDWLDAEGWDHQPPPPHLPDEVVAQTREKYLEAYDRLTK